MLPSLAVKSHPSAREPGDGADVMADYRARMVDEHLVQVFIHLGKPAGVGVGLEVEHNLFRPVFGRDGIVSEPQPSGQGWGLMREATCFRGANRSFGLT